MPYQYTCNACSVASPTSSLRGPALAARAEHRAAVHDGMQPATGDHVHHVMPPVRGIAVIIAVLLLFSLLESVTGVLPEDIARWLGIL